MSSRQTTYQSAGVDIAAADQTKDRIAARVARTHGPEVLRGIGLFGGFFRAPGTNNTNVLVSSADSVGTKVLVAALAEMHRGIGIDLVNHCVNDILACGARPLFFLDYYATPELDPKAVEQIIDGMSQACEAAGCALIGGETAQLPGIYRPGTYDLAGFIVGNVEEDEIVDGSSIEAGDVVIGLPSSGLHTNGFSLARAALGLSGDAEASRRRLAESPDWSGQSWSELLLEPHRSYLSTVMASLQTGGVRGMAHITGGGLEGNLSRVIPDGLTARIDLDSWRVPELFRAIQQTGNVSAEEMYQVFNMGIGFVLVVSPETADEVVRISTDGLVLGEITTNGHARVELTRRGTGK